PQNQEPTVLATVTIRARGPVNKLNLSPWASSCRTRNDGIALSAEDSSSDHITAGPKLNNGSCRGVDFDCVPTAVDVLLGPIVPDTSTFLSSSIYAPYLCRSRKIYTIT
ncbi:hypothetical protein IG631_24324, partial [Alternaria alternata]